MVGKNPSCLLFLSWWLVVVPRGMFSFSHRMTTMRYKRMASHHNVMPMLQGSRYVSTEPHGRDVYTQDLERRSFLSKTLAIISATLVSTEQQKSAWAAPTTASFAKKDISGRDFAGQDLSGIDFTAASAKKAIFRNCNLQNAVFDKADLVNADFSGANLQGASFLDATLDGTSFANAQAQKCIFSGTILDVGNFENVDLTDSLWPSKYRVMICDMDELRGTNPVTGIESKESLMCTDYTRQS